MEIVVADNAGACYGVNRSLDIVIKASKTGKKIATLGELIHNPLVVKELEVTYNVSAVDSVDAAIGNDIDTLVIRSHGVSIDILNDAISRGIEVIDATCPYVKNVQNTAKVLAGLYPAVLIIGKKGHPEVESVSSFVISQGTKCYIAETIEEINNILDELKKIDDSIGVVSQTTQSLDVFNTVVEYLKTNKLKLEIENTICAATKKRQESAQELASKVDAMLVIGGHNSSNTNHLTELCNLKCKNVFHIESIDELDASFFDGISVLGVTAGASTPKSQVDKVLEKIKCL